MLRSQRLRKDELRCPEIDPATRRVCNMPFTRAWNLKRDQRDQHGDQNTVFINYNPTATRGHMATPPAILRSPALTQTLLIAPQQETVARHSLVQTTQAPWCQAPTMPLQAPSPAPMMTLVSPVPAATTPISAQTMSVSRTRTPANLTPPQIPAASATITSPPIAPQMGVPGSTPWRLDTPIQDASSSSTLASPHRSGSMRTPTVSESTSTPPEFVSSRGSVQSTDRVAHTHSVRESEDQTSQDDAIEYGTIPQFDQTSQFEQDFESDKAASDNQTSNDDASGIRRKRKRSTDRGRIIDARLKTAVPTHSDKRSKKTPGQQRGLDWLTVSGKAHSDDTLVTFLAQWGVKAGHRGSDTCVFLPQDWKAMNPTYLMAVFQDHKLPSGGSSRA